ncbi:hypothetical protein BDV10DRAFT_36402 [Aspergillus recurvatus]
MSVAAGLTLFIYLRQSPAAPVHGSVIIDPSQVQPLPCYATPCHLPPQPGVYYLVIAGAPHKTEQILNLIRWALRAVIRVNPKASAGGAHRVCLPFITGARESRASTRATATGETQEISGLVKQIYRVFRIIMHSSVADSRAGASNNRCRALPPFPSIRGSGPLVVHSEVSEIIAYLGRL